MEDEIKTAERDAILLKLQESGERYRSLVENIHLGITSLDRGYRIVTINRVHAAMIGKSVDDCIGQECFRIFEKKEAVCAHCPGTRAMASGLPAETEATAVRDDGSPCEVRVQAFPVCHSDGTVTGFIEVVEDITDRKQARAALAESEAKYQHLIETTGTGYLILDEQGRVVDANAEYARLSGHQDLREILGRCVVEWTAPHDRQRNAQEVEKCLRTGSVRHLEVDYVRADGAITPVEINASVICTKEGRRILSLCRDITKRRNVEVALRESEKRERRTLKHMLRATDHERQVIAYDIHDGLAQHLAAALMHFELFDHLKDANLQRAAEAYRAGIKMLRQGHSEARRLISGVRPPILDEEGVVAAIEHLVSERQGEDEPQIELCSRVAFTRLAPILENAIYRIVQEGLTNACKHSQSKRVEVSLMQRDDQLYIEIRDGGVGFDVDTGSESRFGLQGIRERVRLLGGKVTIRSHPGKGTCLGVELPVVERESHQD